MPHPWPFLGPTNLPQREMSNLRPNGTNIDNCPEGRSLCATLNLSGGRFRWGGVYYKLRDMILFYLKEYTLNFCFDIFSRSVSVIGVKKGYLEVFRVLDLKLRGHFLSRGRG